MKPGDGVVFDEGHPEQDEQGGRVFAVKRVDRGRVEITTRTDESGEESSCVVAVADSGRGIAPEHLEQIFDPFFTTKDAGSGLGLFVAHEIVTHHGGGITAAPRAEGGTVFTIHFPVRASRPQVDVVAG